MNDTDGIAPALAYLGLGSNLGDRSGNLEIAVDHLRAHEQVEVVCVAEPIDTEPMYVLDQPRFLNTCAAIRTTLSPRELLALLLDIETRMGRERTQAKGPRVIDLDVLFYGERIIDEPGLTVPHPRILERDFVLLPLAAIAPDLIHPTTGHSIGEHAHVFEGD